MTAVELLEQTVHELEKLPCTFALAGGFAATFYRAEPRQTWDVDLLLKTEGNSILLAEELIRHFGMVPRRVTLAQLSQAPGHHKKSSPVAIVAGINEQSKNEQSKTAARLDFLLAALPWVNSGLERAQYHRINFPFGSLPTIPIEDLIIAKTFSCAQSTTRLKDLDDILSIFHSGNHLDLDYLTARFDALKLSLPREAERLAPKALAVASKRIRSSGKGPARHAQMKRLFLREP